MNKDLKEYISTIYSDVKREDCFSLIGIMEEESGYEATLRGKIVGFGIHHYIHDNGRQGDAIVTGFGGHR